MAAATRNEQPEPAAERHSIVTHCTSVRRDLENEPENSFLIGECRLLETTPMFFLDDSGSSMAAGCLSSSDPSC